ncbi:MAG: type I DNA topoisomerase [Methyloprofundus sp.]|nr:type I DNA topoisomerase [Methyloprofundus sp.]
MNLFIVESPGKVKSIQKYLGSGWKVMASVGHIRDLPVKEMGIEFNSWRLKYQLTDKGKGVYSKLKAAATNADKIYLATDLDREGEAIAWHLAVMLKIPESKIYRVKYAEITESAIKKALSDPGKIDMNLVHAQEARRAIDRLVGYTVSPAVSRANNMRLSAGRVQSIIVRLIADRYQAFVDFKSRDYFGALIKLDGFEADWNTKPYLPAGDDYNFDRDLAVQAADVDRVSVVATEHKDATQKPPAPFITSSMQQAAVKKLGMNTEQAMKYAQELYEAALITYHRTDSVELSDDAVAMIRSYAQSENLHLPATPNKFKGKSKNAQEAHEAIRPTDISVTSASDVSEGAAMLYQLIHKQALVCQLAPAKLKKTTVKLVSDDGRFEYIAKGSVLVEPGFMVVSGAGEDKVLPPINEGDIYDVIEGAVQDKKTKAPSLFDEASLLGELERLGIGRPSTWAPAIKNIKQREYVKIDKKKLVPTDTGMVLRRSLDGFGFMEYNFTAEIEDQMDAVSSGHDSYHNCVTQIFQSVVKDLSSHFGYVGEGEDFFLPPKERDYQASEKQVAVAKKMADALGIDLDIDLTSGKAVSAFLEANANAYKASFKPSDKQLEYAQGLAQTLGVSLGSDVLSSALKLSGWIDKHRELAFAKRPPTEKQLAFAQKLADENGVELPDGIETNSGICSEFIDQFMGASKRKKTSKTKRSTTKY